MMTTDEFPRRLLTSREAASRLGLTEQTLREWRVRGRGPRFVRISRTRVRYRPQDLGDFEARNIFSSTVEADQAEKKSGRQ